MVTYNTHHKSLKQKPFFLNFLQISYIHSSHLCSHSNVPLSFPTVEPRGFWSTEMTIPKSTLGNGNIIQVFQDLWRVFSAQYKSLKKKLFFLSFLQISNIHSSHLCSHSNVPLSFPNVEPRVFWSTGMTAIPKSTLGKAKVKQVFQELWPLLYPPIQAFLGELVFHLSPQTLPWVPETVLVRSPVSVKSL